MKQITYEQYLALDHAERRAAREKGQIDDLLRGRPVDPDATPAAIPPIVATREQYVALSPADRRTARKNGRLDYLLGITNNEEN